MNPFISKIIIDAAKRQLKKNKQRKPSDADLARLIHQLRIQVIYTVRNAAFIIIGVFAAAFGLKGFLLPNDFIDGGVTGMSLLVRAVSGISLPLLIVVINLPFIVLGYFHIGKQFAYKSIAAIMGLALVLLLVEYPVITSDKLLIAVFGGFFLGAGIGLAVRGGAVLDGTEVLAIYLSKKTGLTIGDIILIFNIVIFATGAYILSTEVALYAILTYLAASKTIDFVIEGVEEYTGITIVSARSEQIRLMIIEKLGRGVTIYNGKRGYAPRGETLTSTEVVYTVVTRLEIARLQREVDSIDPDAFLIMNSIKDVKGGMIKRRPLKE